MFDLIALFLILIFAPIIIFNGKKYYKISTEKSVRVLTYIFLGLELFRFFYTARFYPRAYMPSDKVTFTFITFSLLVCLFAVFNKNKFGSICKTMLTFTALAPVVLAICYPHVYTNELDQYAVVKALYFAETGINLTIALLFLKEEVAKLNIKSLLFTLAFLAVYIFANVMRNIYWIANMSFDLKWYLCMGIIVILSIAIYLVGLLLKRKITKIND